MGRTWKEECHCSNESVGRVDHRGTIAEGCSARQLVHVQCRRCRCYRLVTVTLTAVEYIVFIASVIIIIIAIVCFLWGSMLVKDTRFLSEPFRLGAE